MAHVFYIVALVALGYGLGRIHQWAKFRGTVVADTKAVVAEVKKL